MTIVIGARLEDNKGHSLNEYIKKAGYHSTSDFIRDCVDKALSSEVAINQDEDFRVIRMALGRIEQRSNCGDEERLLIEIGRETIAGLNRDSAGNIIRKDGRFLGRVTARRNELIKEYAEMLKLPFVAES